MRSWPGPPHTDNIRLHLLSIGEVDVSGPAPQAPAKRVAPRAPVLCGRSCLPHGLRLPLLPDTAQLGVEDQGGGPPPGLEEAPPSALRLQADISTLQQYKPEGKTNHYRQKSRYTAHLCLALPVLGYRYAWSHWLCCPACMRVKTRTASG